MVSSRKVIRYIVRLLPLVGVVVVNLLPISVRMGQILVLTVLLWLQVFIVYDVFLNGR